MAESESGPSLSPLEVVLDPTASVGDRHRLFYDAIVEMAENGAKREDLNPIKEQLYRQLKQELKKTDVKRLRQELENDEIKSPSQVLFLLDAVDTLRDLAAGKSHFF